MQYCKHSWILNEAVTTEGDHVIPAAVTTTLDTFSRKCPYAILGVSETATTAEIKRAFQDRAKITHPDVVKGKDSHFREMVEAYRILRDPRKRAEHLGADVPQSAGSPFESMANGC
eukprot:Skav207322  [mRNA]  locus=scaffold3027:83182:85256:- [translate_table: standard]